MDIKLNDEFLISKKEMKKIMSGSLEDRLSRIHREFLESDSFYNVRHFATYDGYILVLSEDGIFRCNYRDDGEKIDFSGMKKEGISLTPANKLVSECVSDCVSDISLVEDSLRRLVFEDKLNKSDPFEKINESLSELFNSEWIDILNKNMDGFIESIGEQKVKYDEYLIEDKWKNQKDLLTSLGVLKENLDEIYNKVNKSYNMYRKECIGLTEDELYQDFNVFCEDYVKNIGKIKDFVSESFDGFNNGGCALCAAMVHDGIYNKMNKLKLAERFVQFITNKSISGGE